MWACARHSLLRYSESFGRVCTFLFLMHSGGGLQDLCAECRMARLAPGGNGLPKAWPTPHGYAIPIAALSLDTCCTAPRHKSQTRPGTAVAQRSRALHTATPRLHTSTRPPLLPAPSSSYFHNGGSGGWKGRGPRCRDLLPSAAAAARLCLHPAPFPALPPTREKSSRSWVSANRTLPCQPTHPPVGQCTVLPCAPRGCAFPGCPCRRSLSAVWASSRTIPRRRSCSRRCAWR